MRFTGRLAACAWCLALAVTARAGQPAPDFAGDVRPILARACFPCHGPDAARRQAELRLDTREGAVGSGVVVSGEPAKSRLIARVTSADPDEIMPPPESGRALSASELETLRRWVAGGAQWPGHWAYEPLRRPAVPPEPSEGQPARNPIDRFVRARLAERGLTPAPEAGRATLARRLSLDLTGLPPTPAEVDAFVNDPAPDAYEKVVARLMASPHFGERVAQWWLDLVRYADTTGYHGDTHRDVALYRDYVIDAFNRNLPFDRFTVEQLAGDLLPGATDAQRVASGYNRLLMTTAEPGAQAREYVARYAADRVRNAASVWLGSTLGCAECHDHKSDPFTSRDFYRFAAFFADVQEPAVGTPEPTRFPTPAQAASVRSLAAEASRLRHLIDTPTPELAAAQAAWEKAAAVAPEWDVLTPASAVSEGGATLAVGDDGSVRASGSRPERDVYRLTLPVPRGLTALKLDVLPDGKLPAYGPGRADDGGFVLTEISAAGPAKALKIAWASATHAAGGDPVTATLDGRDGTGWSVQGESGRPNAAVFRLAGPTEAVRLTVTLSFQAGASKTLGRFRFSGTTADVAAGSGALPSKVASALRLDAGERTPAQAEALATYYRTVAPELQPARDAMAAVDRERAGVEAAMPRSLVTTSGPPRVVRILPRGNWLDESGPVVTPGVPEALGAAVGGSRLDLARWLTSPENPLTARVLANRLWALAFGRGLVATPDDLGTSGSGPTHPELHDWLAAELVQSGWDVKHVLTLIVTSATYRQSSRAPASVREVDPDNRWLARQARYRLDAEALRDGSLAVSGLLTRAIGGPSAKPDQPAGYWSHLSFPKREYRPDRGPALYRRGVYNYRCRTFLHPALLAFDAPTREACAAVRLRSNTPRQALVLLNEPTHVEAARALAVRVVREGGGDDSTRLTWLYREVLTRPPRPNEREVLAALVRRHRDHYRSDPGAAAEVARRGDGPAPAGLDPADLAAWTSAGRVLLNLNETVTRD